MISFLGICYGEFGQGSLSSRFIVAKIHLGVERSKNIFRKCACITLINSINGCCTRDKYSVYPETYEEVMVAPENLQSRQGEVKK